MRVVHPAVIAWTPRWLVALHLGGAHPHPLGDDVMLYALLLPRRGVDLRR